MHTSAGAACGRDDDNAPELRMCRSLRTLKVKEIARHVNLSLLDCKYYSRMQLKRQRGTLNLILQKNHQKRHVAAEESSWARKSEKTAPSGSINSRKIN